MKPSRKNDRRARLLPHSPGVEGLEIRLALSGEPFLFSLGPAPTGSTLMFFEPSPSGDPSGFDGPPPPVFLLPEPPPTDSSGGGAVPLDPPPIGLPDPSTGTEPPIGWPASPPTPGAPAPIPVPTPTEPAPIDEAPPSSSPRVNAIEPADGAGVVSGSFDSIAVRFGTPISPVGLSPRNFKLERIGNDGRPEPIFDRSNSPPQRLEGGGTTLSLALPGPLAPGRYRLTMYGGSVFTSVGGELLVAGPEDEILSDFLVSTPAASPVPTPVPTPGPPAPNPAAPRTPVGPTALTAPVPSRSEPAPGGVTLDRATPLGTIGPELRTVAGTLDLAADPGAVRLYRIELAPGHFWRLGLEVSAGRQGSPLVPTLTLFDASGKLIATGTDGRSDAPLDPFLFAGLRPGTYYVGVSGAANDPAAGGYDPATGAPGVNVGPQPGGSFSLALVADVADAPTRILGLGVDRLDPADPVPTGFTLHFDGPVRSDSPGTPGGSASSERLVEVVDQDGRLWPAMAIAYDEAGAALSFLFLDRLPTGRYEVRLPSSRGLVDLTGRSPVTEGQAVGVLGRFEVTSEPSSRDPNDLGALLPNRASSGVAVGLRLGPAEAATIRVVITVETEYIVTLSEPGGALAIEAFGPDGPLRFASDPAGLEGGRIILKPGIYQFRVINAGADQVDATFGLRSLTIDHDSVPLNGVGQGPALGMRLVTPASGLDRSPPGTGGSGTTSPSGAALVLAPPPAPATPPKADPTAVGEFLAAGEPGLGRLNGPLMTFETEPIGRPTSLSLPIAAVDPDRGGGLAATASLAGGAELWRSVPAGIGQSLDRLGNDGRSGPGPADGRREAPEGDGGQGGADSPGGPDAGPPEADAPARPAPEDRIDSALAMLYPTSFALPGPAFSDHGAGPPFGGPPSEESAEEGEAEGPTPSPLVRAVGVGLALGWTARRWSRRRPRPVGAIGPRGVASPGSPDEEADDSAIIGELIRRHPRLGPSGPTLALGPR